MTYGLAKRNTMHAMGTGNPVFTPIWRAVAPLVMAKGLDGRLRQLYRGDVCDWLSDEQARHFLRLGLIERISADTQGAVVDAADAPAEHADLDDTADTDAGPADCGAVNECIGVLDRLQVPITAGAPAARTALRGNGFRYSNAVVAAAVKHRKELSRTVRDADAETFEVVVV
jgi:hypothetical protein